MNEDTFAPTTGESYALEDNLALVLAPNPSPMTNRGTNTYLLGSESVVVIDPGPDDPTHLGAILRAIDGRPVTHILVTHSHLDHSPLATPLSHAVDAQIVAFGDSQAGRSDVMQALGDGGLIGGGEGIDVGFDPDIHISDGDVVETPSGPVTALHTPGHLGNHLCFTWGDRVFTGDHVMGWASSLVSPPDGDLTDFMMSCDKLHGIAARVYYPGHGAPVTDPAGRIEWLIAHRRAREAQIIQALAAGGATATEITRMAYTDVPSSLLPAAARNVLAHLIDLHVRGKVSAEPALTADAKFNLIP